MARAAADPASPFVAKGKPNFGAHALRGIAGVCAADLTHQGHRRPGTFTVHTPNPACGNASL